MSAPTPGVPDLLPVRVDDLWDMEALVWLALFSDAREPEAEGLDGHGGWWAELLDLPQSEPFGSRLWQLFREPANAGTAARAGEAAKEALRWLVSEGLADRVEATGIYEAPDRINLKVTVTRGDRDWAFLFADLWRKYV